jgi:hypothetical protein
MSPELTSAVLKLPTLVISPTDIARLTREVEALNDWFDAAKIRSPNEPIRLPRTSRLLEELAQVNKLDLQVESDRQKTVAYLAAAKTKAPVVHISFSADPSAVFMVKLVTWLRQNIHPQLLVRIGLQPTIAAGCILRTENRVYDFSLRGRLIASRDQLIDALHQAAG